jgi:hypothetical protein
MWTEIREPRGGGVRTRPRSIRVKISIVLHDKRLQSILSWGDPRFSHEREIMTLLLGNRSRQYRRVAHPGSCRCHAVCRP